MEEIRNFSKYGEGHRNQKGIAVPPLFSEGVTNTPVVFNRLVSDELKPATLRLRSMLGSASDQEIADYKLLHLPSITAGGIFPRRNAASCQKTSGLMPIDVDDLHDTSEARAIMKTLLSDPSLDFDLMYVSPSGNGLKGLLRIPQWLNGMDYRDQFEIVSMHIAMTHGVTLDPSGSDICRLAFLCWDPEAYIHPDYHNPLNK